ncbi:hypothetical protein CC80DRAFT_499490 [Byssothecium circinans]|uniref:Peptidyl-prolyl cis-trans isomerase-like 2 n=1 Tax=Byssothecium circinans TaxID=147558 RepID=A0A6A5UA47_9PLEO|nr:hypothetical protein CC80DRAFT_499490 [Byssothecium circinans]
MCSHELHPSAPEHTPSCPDCIIATAKRKLDHAQEELVNYGGLHLPPYLLDGSWKRAKLAHSAATGNMGMARRKDQLRWERERAWDDAHLQADFASIDAGSSFDLEKDCPVCVSANVQEEEPISKYTNSQSDGNQYRAWWERPNALAPEEGPSTLPRSRAHPRNSPRYSMRGSPPMRKIIHEQRAAILKRQKEQQHWEFLCKTEAAVRRKHALSADTWFGPDFWEDPISGIVTRQNHRNIQEDQRMAERRARGNKPRPRPARSSLSSCENADEIGSDEEVDELQQAREEEEKQFARVEQAAKEVGWLYFVWDGLEWDWGNDEVYFASNLALVWRKEQPYRAELEKRDLIPVLMSTDPDEMDIEEPYSYSPSHSPGAFAVEYTATMGKGTDKLYITHSEWSSADSFGTSRGANTGRASAAGLASTFKRLPFNYCAVSLQPFTDPVCTASGSIFDLTHILTWLSKHPDTNPIDGTPLKRADLITLHFTKNEEGEYVDPVTFKVFTDNTHIVALRKSGNVFSWDTVERLNIKAKNWRDLVSDEEFTRKDIITLQDPQNIESRDYNSYKHIRDGETVVPESESSINTEALGNAGKIMKAREAVAKARAERQAKAQGKPPTTGAVVPTRKTTAAAKPATTQTAKPAYNAAVYTSGKAAASFTSTGMTPHTSAERAVLSDEDYMLKPKRIKQKGYARMSTSLGDLNIEILPEYAPRAVWNFVQLAKKGYYRNTIFHRNIRNFMIQGGDPTGTGRGGQSIWGKPFNDEFDGPNTHSTRGILSMANKGKNTNTSQFFISYRQLPHLDRKHTIFARVVGGLDTTLKAMELAETGEKDRPVDDIEILDVVVFVDPFEEWKKERSEKETKEQEAEEIRKQGGTADDKTTWTGKRIRADGKVDEKRGGGLGVGKYLQQAKEEANQRGEDEIVGFVDEEEDVAPVKKKAKTGGGFGNFDAW